MVVTAVVALVAVVMVVMELQDEYRNVLARLTCECDVHVCACVCNVPLLLFLYICIKASGKLPYLQVTWAFIKNVIRSWELYWDFAV